MRKERSTVGNLINMICSREHIHKKDIAERMGVANITYMSTSEPRLSTLLELLKATGYCLVVSKNENSAGMVLFQDDPCQQCRYKVFSEAIDEAMSNLHVAVNESGYELDFYPDDGITNHETE